MRAGVRRDQEGDVQELGQVVSGTEGVLPGDPDDMRGEQDRRRLQGDGEELRIPDEAQAPVLLRLGVGRDERREGVPAGDHDGAGTQGEPERRFHDHGARITRGIIVR